LFKWIGSSSETSGAPQDGTYDPTAVEEDGLFFAAQTIQNACGTQAILSVVLNNDTSSGAASSGASINVGSSLQEFKDFTTGFDAGLRGESLSNSEMIRTVHNSFAKSSPFVEESARDPSAGTEDVFHFIGYTCHHNKLYELDGLQPFPISHGDCTTDEFPDKIIPVLQRRIARYPAGEVRFNLMALCQDLRVKAQEFQDFDMLAREERKRTQWDFENALRRHNFVGFTAEVLKGVVKMKVQDGAYDGWVDEARKTTEKRLRERKKFVEA
jgi:ubiquitin carboxyl-terminal hydrolase L5